jgi:5-methylcytosine-specific restriction endonuclease McrA
MFEYRPYSKEMQLKGHQKEKKQYKAKKPKKKKKPYVYKGRTIPKKKERTKISKTNYMRMIEEFGDCCMICGKTPIDAHHIVFRSQYGSGNWRNLAPLCKEHHTMAHKDRNFAEYLREERRERFGKWFWADKYTLFKEGLIPTPTDEMFERFMQEQESEGRK